MRGINDGELSAANCAYTDGGTGMPCSIVAAGGRVDGTLL